MATFGNSPEGTEAIESTEIFIGRQPILDRSQELIAFELLFRGGRTLSAIVNDDTQATASVIANSLGELGLDRVLSGHRAFINFSTQMLMSDLVDILPADKVTLEILETVDLTSQEVTQRIFELKDRGFQIALDDVSRVGPEIYSMRGLADVVKLDLKQIAPEQLPDLVMQLKLWPVRVLAEKIDSQVHAQRCLELGIDLFQGYHFARPEIISGRRVDPGKALLLRLLAMVLSDANDEHIEAELKGHPNLVFSLLGIVNSVAYGTGKKVTSLRQCMVILGRRQLQRWIQLLLYADPTPGNMARNPLIHTVAARARSMELLAGRAAQSNREAADRAFMVGMLSLLDVMWKIPMAQIVSQLPLDARVKDALTHRSGYDGKLLQLIEFKEANDMQAVASVMRDLDNVTWQQLSEADWQAVLWADQLSQI